MAFLHIVCTFRSNMIPFSYMLFSGQPGLEDRIIELTVSGGLTVKSLHARLKHKEPLSLRAVYKAIHNLIGAGVILKVGKQIMLDQEWVVRVGNELRPLSVHSLAPGERTAYTTVTIEHLDALWKTVVLPMEKLSRDNEIFFYNPHNFWAYMPERKESEDAYYRHFADAGHHGFFIVGGNSEADREFKRRYQSGHLQIDLRNISSHRRTDHITVIGTLIITARLTEVTASRIDTLYASDMSIKDILTEIIQICQSPGKIRLTLENNSAKATQLKKILSKNFYFKH